MIINVMCAKEYLSWTYADFVRFTFKNEIVQDKMMASESDYQDGVMTFNVLDPDTEFLNLMKTLYPEYMFIQ